LKELKKWLDAELKLLVTGRTEYEDAVIFTLMEVKRFVEKLEAKKTKR
jgi:hypothetical protein